MAEAKRFDTATYAKTMTGYTSVGWEGFKGAPPAPEPRRANNAAALVRITVGGGKTVHEFRGRTFVESDTFATADLGWDDETWAAAHLDPLLCLEFFNERGQPFTRK
jgi:hypothetical protein